MKENNINILQSIVSKKNFSHTDVDCKDLTEFVWDEIDHINSETIWLLHRSSIIHAKDFMVIICAKGLDSENETMIKTFIHEHKHLINTNGEYIRQYPIHVAINHCHGSTVHLLIDNNADVTLRGDNNETPLYASCLKGDAEITDAILSKVLQDGSSDVNTYINKCNDDEKTPLWICAYSNRIDHMEKLLTHNPDMEKPDSRGRSPVGIAHECGNEEAVELLQKHGSYPTIEPSLINATNH